MIEAIQTLRIILQEMEEKNEEEDSAIFRLKKVLTASATMLHGAVRVIKQLTSKQLIKQ